jgi:hypothetical protein
MPVLFCTAQTTSPALLMDGCCAFANGSWVMDQLPVSAQTLIGASKPDTADRRQKIRSISI